VALVDVIMPYFGTYYNLGEIYRWKKEIVWGRKDEGEKAAEYMG
jgi:hypothetical protein